jgi:hypothetical protein
MRKSTDQCGTDGAVVIAKNGDGISLKSIEEIDQQSFVYDGPANTRIIRILCLPDG